jgi:hypothetical protein
MQRAIKSADYVAQHYSDEIFSSLVILEFIILVQILQGIILGLIRVQEPIFWLSIKIEVKSWFGYLSTEDIQYKETLDSNF